MKADSGDMWVNKVSITLFAVGFLFAGLSAIGSFSTWSAMAVTAGLSIGLWLFLFAFLLAEGSQKPQWLSSSANWRRLLVWSWLWTTTAVTGLFFWWTTVTVRVVDGQVAVPEVPLVPTWTAYVHGIIIALLMLLIGWLPRWYVLTRDTEESPAEASSIDLHGGTPLSGEHSVAQSATAFHISTETNHNTSHTSAETGNESSAAKQSATVRLRAGSVLYAIGVNSAIFLFLTWIAFAAFVFSLSDRSSVFDVFSLSFFNDASMLTLLLLPVAAVYAVAWVIRYGFWESARKRFRRAAEPRHTRRRVSFGKEDTVSTSASSRGSASVTPPDSSDIGLPESVPAQKSTYPKGARFLWLAGRVLNITSVAAAIFFLVLDYGIVTGSIETNSEFIDSFVILLVFAASFYAMGQSLRFVSKRSALYLYRKAAKEGNADAQYKLILVYETSRRASNKSSELLSWLRNAAERGIATAQYYLGRRYETGLGISQDFSLAIELYERSANLGNASAQKSLARLFAEDHSAAKDNLAAADWNWFFTRRRDINRVALERGFFLGSVPLAYFVFSMFVFNIGYVPHDIPQILYYMWIFPFMIGLYIYVGSYWLIQLLPESIRIFARLGSAALLFLISYVVG